VVDTRAEASSAQARIGDNIAMLQRRRCEMSFYVEHLTDRAASLAIYCRAGYRTLERLDAHQKRAGSRHQGLEAGQW
jgi:hypothetical protein